MNCYHTVWSVAPVNLVTATHIRVPTRKHCVISYVHVVTSVPIFPRHDLHLRQLQLQILLVSRCRILVRLFQMMSLFSYYDQCVPTARGRLGLEPGEFWFSDQDFFFFSLTTTGDLGLFDANHRVLWSAGTSCRVRNCKGVYVSLYFG